MTAGFVRAGVWVTGRVCACCGLGEFRDERGIGEGVELAGDDEGRLVCLWCYLLGCRLGRAKHGESGGEVRNLCVVLSGSDWSAWRRVLREVVG